jgi:MFS family permease
MTDAAAGTEGNRWVTLVLVCLAQFMVVLDATIVNIALPTIQKDLHFSQATCSG